MTSNEHPERFEVKEHRSTTEALILDVWALDRLVKCRIEWLNQPYNKLRNTYCAIAADTRKMEEQLKMLEKELKNEITRK